MKLQFLQGNESCADAAIAAGLRFFAGYPITPSTEIAERLAEKLPQVGGKFIQMEDEIASMAAVIGASLAGVKAMTATSGPGFSLKQENIGYAYMAEVPCVVVDVQRAGPSTGLPTSPAQGDVMQARWGTHGDHPAVVLSPSSVEEVYHLTIRAFNISEELRMPVILCMDEVVAHMREKVNVPEEHEIVVVNRKKPAVPRERYVPYGTEDSDVPPMAAFGDGYRFHVTGLHHGPSGFPVNKGELAAALVKRLCSKVERRRRDLVKYSLYRVEDAQVVVFAYGSTARSALRAVKMAREKGIAAGLFKATTLWPFPDEELRSACGSARAVVVPEMNLGQLIREVERAVCGRALVCGVNRVDGDAISPGEILDGIKGVA